MRPYFCGMSNSSTKQAVEQIRQDLFSADEGVVMRALLRCRDEGNLTLIGPLIALYARTPHDQVRSEVSSILQSVKVANAEEPFMEAILQPEYRPVRRDLISFMWNAGLQPVSWLADLSRIAVEGTLEEAIECLTLLETMDDVFPGDQLLESMQLVRQAIHESPEDEKARLLALYLGRLESLEED